ncbi:TPA: NERD domain-containing protein [Clostridioides difficile]|uniref:nuclease-related domain-containing protein n=1 Tax=Clostridioides difficile TaxID=1496 RepID=UPI001C1A2202|nr:NERD domain-containing protein [Clostridioides difficile]
MLQDLIDLYSLPVLPIAWFLELITMHTFSRRIYLWISLFIWIILSILLICKFFLHSKYGYNLRLKKRDIAKLKLRRKLQDNVIKEEILSTLRDYNLEKGPISGLIDIPESKNIKLDLIEKQTLLKNELEYITRYKEEKTALNFDEYLNLDTLNYSKLNFPKSLAWYEEDVEYLKEFLPIDVKSHYDTYSSLNKMIKEYNFEINDIQKSLAIINKGVKGEEAVKNELKWFTDRYKVLENINILIDKEKHETSESDFIIISKNGVFVVEVKNYGSTGDTLIASSDGNWYIKDKYENIEPINNIASQNNRHCGINQYLINRELKNRGYNLETKIDCTSIIVIANKEIVIENNTPNTVIRPSEILNVINNHKPNFELDEKLQDEIVDILKEYSIDASKFPAVSRKEKIEALLYNINILESGIKASAKIANDYYMNYL